MEFLVTTNNTTTFSNKELQKSTDAVFKLGDAIKKNWFAIAHIISHVDETECYKDDGFNTVHEWVENTFGIKKSSSYSLLTIGKEYTREIKSASGKVIGYGTNLISDGDDFSKTQVEKMLPAGHDLALEMVENGEITPEMSAKEISRVVKSHTNPDINEPEEPEDDAIDTTGEEVENDTIEDGYVLVWDKDGIEYHIPKEVLEQYAVYKEK